MPETAVIPDGQRSATPGRFRSAAALVLLERRRPRPPVLMVGLGSQSVAATLGGPLGRVRGCCQRWVDATVMRLADA